MDMESTIRAYQTLLPSWKWEPPTDEAEAFAITRYAKKMEIPDKSKSDARAEETWLRYIKFDESLTLPRLLPGNWYKARILLHKWMRGFKLGDLEYTPGSSAEFTESRNSIESKLQWARWDCTSDCWDLWAETAYETLAIKRAARARFAQAMKYDQVAVSEFHKESWKRFGTRPNGPFLCFKRMLSTLTVRCEASRFSTVLKNNETDRPIELQPLCNMLVQRRVGNGLRDLLRGLGYDLDRLSEVHRQLVKDATLATLDLKNASDSVQLALCLFLFPLPFFRLLTSSRATYLEGPKTAGREYHVLRKVSSMGNGFTFELMSMVLLALGLQHDSKFSVFGDDIIVVKEKAREVIQDLEAVGFVVNDQKSFIDGPFRESCGANYLDGYGYLRSFDFRYPENVHDCAVIANKAYLLREVSPQFRKLHDALIRCVPSQARGVCGFVDKDLPVGEVERGFDKDIAFSPFFWDPKWDHRKGRVKVTEPHLLRGLQHIHQPGEFFKITGFKWKAEEATKMRHTLGARRHVGKYFMYLYACRRTPDVITGQGCWQPVVYISDGKDTYRARSIVDVPKGAESNSAH
jgi:hypothetical protein